MNLRLKTPVDIRRALAKVANMTLDGRLDSKTANAFVACANVLLQSLRIDDQEKRLQDLEKLLSEMERR